MGIPGTSTWARMVVKDHGTVGRDYPGLLNWSLELCYDGWEGPYEEWLEKETERIQKKKEEESKSWCGSSSIPSTLPSGYPTAVPSYVPSSNPSHTPTLYPTKTPTGNPTHKPTLHPPKDPTGNPSRKPSFNPTESPTVISSPNTCKDDP